MFCTETLPKGSLIEICPIIFIPANEVDIIHHTELHDYYFVWGENDDCAAIALGYGSLYNHSYKPNAEFILDYDQKTIDFVAIKTIPSGQEITVNYHGDSKCKDPLWFDETGTRIRRIKAGEK